MSKLCPEMLRVEFLNVKKKNFNPRPKTPSLHSLFKNLFLTLPLIIKKKGREVKKIQ